MSSPTTSVSPQLTEPSTSTSTPSTSTAAPHHQHHHHVKSEWLGVPSRSHGLGHGQAAGGSSSSVGLRDYGSPAWEDQGTRIRPSSGPAAVGGGRGASPSRESMILRRREANRLAAQRFRNRKKGYQDSLEERVRALEEERTTLVRRLGQVDERDWDRRQSNEDFYGSSSSYKSHSSPYPYPSSSKSAPDTDPDLRVARLESANRRLQEDLKLASQENDRLRATVDRWVEWERNLRAATTTRDLVPPLHAYPPAATSSLSLSPAEGVAQQQQTRPRRSPPQFPFSSAPTGRRSPQPHTPRTPSVHHHLPFLDRDLPPDATASLSTPQDQLPPIRLPAITHSGPLSGRSPSATSSLPHPHQSRPSLPSISSYSSDRRPSPPSRW